MRQGFQARLPLVTASLVFPQLGGFLGRKSDKEPGVKTIWRGMRRLHDISSTWKLLRSIDF